MVRVSTAALALACSHVAPVVGFAPLSVGGRSGSLGSLSHNRLAASRGYRIAAKKGRELAVVSGGRGEVGRRNRINRVLEGGGGGVAALGGLVGVLFAVYGVVVAALAGTVGALFGLYYGSICGGAPADVHADSSREGCDRNVEAARISPYLLGGEPAPADHCAAHQGKVADTSIRGGYAQGDRVCRRGEGGAALHLSCGITTNCTYRSLCAGHHEHSTVSQFLYARCDGARLEECCH